VFPVSLSLLYYCPSLSLSLIFIFYFFYLTLSLHTDNPLLSFERVVAHNYMILYNYIQHAWLRLPRTAVEVDFNAVLK